MQLAFNIRITSLFDFLRFFRMKRPGAGGPPTVNLNEKAKIDEEYLSLMAELGEAPPKDDAVRGRMGTGKSFSTAGGQGLFDKASAPKAIMAPQPTSTSAASTTAGAAPTPMMPPTAGNSIIVQFSSSSVCMNTNVFSVLIM